MLRIVPHTVPRVGRSYEHFPDGFELHLLQVIRKADVRLLGDEIQGYLGNTGLPGNVDIRLPGKVDRYKATWEGRYTATWDGRY